MQTISHLSKYLVFVVLSCVLLITRDCAYIGNTVTNVLNATDNNTSSYVRTVDSDAADANADANVDASANADANADSDSNSDSNSIWSSLSSAFQIDHQVQSSRVKTEIRRLVANQGEFYSILEAAAPYIYFIYKQTQEHRLPAELALIPVIESQFNPNDHSNKGALGLWQLMPDTARALGVKIRAGYDGRRNVVASTKAAMMYFRDLGRLYQGNWYLAIAAYNCGEGKVQSAMRRDGSNSFWNLSVLPRDTQYYVPRLLAIAEVIKHPEKYGLELPKISNEPYFTEVNVNKAMPLTKVAKKLDVNIKTLHALNPDDKRAGMVTNKKGQYTVLVPIKTATSDVKVASAKPAAAKPAPVKSATDKTKLTPVKLATDKTKSIPVKPVTDKTNSAPVKSEINKTSVKLTKQDTVKTSDSKATNKSSVTKNNTDKTVTSKTKKIEKPVHIKTASVNIHHHKRSMHYVEYPATYASDY